MEVEVWLKETGKPIIHKEVINTYTKGPFYCVYHIQADGKKVTQKWPVGNIWTVIEPYPDKDRRNL